MTVESCTGGHRSAFYVTASDQKQHGAAAEGCVNHRIDGVLCWDLYHAAGLVVRRFIMMNERPNMSVENRTREVRDKDNGTHSGPAG